MSYTHKMHALPAQYDTAATEKKWQRQWEENKTYAWDATVPRADSYVIDTPPPTVSGTLHMGHVFSYTQADIVARYQRMNGKNVFYPMGFDDNGLPTERLVEKTKKIRATDMSREDFINECLSVSEDARKEFRELFTSIALSVDWAQEYHTISDSSRRLSQLSFLDLVNKGHVYRKLQPMLWDPVDQTAIAQAEVVDKEMPSTANEIIFTVSSSPVTPAQAGVHDGGREQAEVIDSRLRGNDKETVDEKLIIMTTRPELLPACVALFFHPEDARYQHLKGKTATVPLFGFAVPILEDDTVEMEKGTGLMMCCTFGDEADIAKWNKHDLPTRVILNKYGKMDFASIRHSAPMREAHADADSERSGERQSESLSQSMRAVAEGNATKMDSSFRWNDALLERLQNKKASNPDPKNPGAREIILAELEAAGLLLAKKPITHAVKTAERSGAVLELIPSHQWFVRVTDKKDLLKEKAAECDWKPAWMKVRIDQWIDGLNWDWCISRQRYFGVPFPVWYSKRAGEEGKAIYATADQLPVNPLVDLPAGYSRDEVEPDMDVMDTWATSSISPQLSAHGISPELCADPARFSALFPADLRPQAHEIIRTWAFYTLVKSTLHNNSIPWKNLMISGWCLAEDKTKMSKSKGNVVTPVALIEEKGTDAVRYWTATSRLGQDTAFSPDLLKIGKKLVGKLWNATQFAAIHLAKLEAQPLSAKADMEAGRVSEVLDRWILTRLAQTVEKASNAFAAYEYADALDATNQFFWADFCDNYLELIKKRVYNEDGSFTSAQQQSAVVALYHCLSTILKLYAPFCPHVTEELYSHIFAEEYAAKGSLHARGQWPSVSAFQQDKDAFAAGDAALEVLTAIRNAKSTANVSIKFPVEQLTLAARYTDAHGWMADVAGAGNVRTWNAGSDEETTLTLAAEADAA
ncbi:MAG: valine--tRNA ligase [Azospirillum brasilense]|nr:MAG: valine--tRNA ligase [Azospirillum brasilense]